MIGSPIKRARFALGAFAAFSTFCTLACEPVAQPGVLHDGVFCLDHDVDATGVNVVFQLHDNTTLDCQGHSIRDPSGRVNFAVWSNRADNVVVKNCTFDGFWMPIQLVQTTNYRVENNQFSNTWGPTSMSLDGSEGFIARNVVRSRPQNYNWDAVQIQGTADSIGNTVIMGSDDIGAGDYRNGILAYGDGVVANNVVQAKASPGGGGAGFYVQFSLAYRNVFVSEPQGFRVGIACYEESFRFGNVVVGSSPYAEPGCRTNTSSGLKPGGANGLASRH
jgi:hypothetical protein